MGRWLENKGLLEKVRTTQKTDKKVAKFEQKLKLREEVWKRQLAQAQERLVEQRLLMQRLSKEAKERLKRQQKEDLNKTLALEKTYAIKQREERQLEESPKDVLVRMKKKISASTKEVLLALHTATNKIKRMQNLLDASRRKEAQLKARLDSEAEKNKHIQSIFASGLTAVRAPPPPPRRANLPIPVVSPKKSHREAFEKSSTDASRWFK